MSNMKLKKSNDGTTDCSQLAVGMIVENYKKLCELVGERVLTSDSKKTQFKRWNNYFKFEQNGHKFIITEIVENPVPYVDERKLKKSVYTKYIEALLIDYLLNQNGCSVLMSKISWCSYLGMFNAQYLEYSPHNDLELHKNKLCTTDIEKARSKPLKKIIAEKYGLSIESEDVSYFYDTAKYRLYGILNDAIKSMERRFLIRSDRIFIIRMEDGSSVQVGSSVSDKKLMREILRLQQQALTSIGYDTYDQVISAHQTFRYYNELNKLVRKYHKDKNRKDRSWNSIYEMTQIIFLRDELRKRFLKTTEELREMGRDVCKIELNQNIVNALNNTIAAKSENKEDFDKKHWGDPNQMEQHSLIEYFNDEIMSNDDFIKIQSALIDYLIKLD